MKYYRDAGLICFAFGIGYLLGFLQGQHTPPGRLYRRVADLEEHVILIERDLANVRAIATACATVEAGRD